VTPYLDDVQARIISNFAASGLDCSAERHLRLQDNFSFAEVCEESIAQMVRAVAEEGCDAAAIVCTNMRGAKVSDFLEHELDLPVYDSIAVTLWKCLQTAGVRYDAIDQWGRVFRDPRLSIEPS
jgi:maleate isomerase